uniref:Uncharacterized protein n=1 Tax=Rhizophora mucronata TaxID=61149 RepID=A0A2P2NHQ9_RHIMU
MVHTKEIAMVFLIRQIEADRTSSRHQGLNLLANEILCSYLDWNQSFDRGSEWSNLTFLESIPASTADGYNQLRFQSHQYRNDKHPIKSHKCSRDQHE